MYFRNVILIALTLIAIAIAWQYSIPWAVILVGIILLALASVSLSSVLNGGPRVNNAMPPKDEADIVAQHASAAFKFRIVVSLLVLASSLYIILSGQYADAEQKWAFASVGTILGYWLKV